MTDCLFYSLGIGECFVSFWYCKVFKMCAEDQLSD